MWISLHKGEGDGPRESPPSILAQRIGRIGQDHHRIFDLRVASGRWPAVCRLLLTPARQQELKASHHYFVPRPRGTVRLLRSRRLPILIMDSKVVDAALPVQIEKLLAKPWITSLEGQATPIVVVDALDESDRGTEFLKELLRVICGGQLSGIKFLVTSRPDPGIVNMCKSFPLNAVCKLHEVDTANVQKDIEKYLQEVLPELKDELGLLLERAGGLFIYATTTVRFISSPYSPCSVSEVRSHLQAMLNPEPSTTPANGE